MECRGGQPQMDSGGVTESTRLTEQVKTQEKTGKCSGKSEHS